MDTSEGKRVALVTGGASGIGAATARRLAAEGFELVLADLADAGPVAAEIAAAGGAAHGVRLDVRDAAAVGALVDGLVGEGAAIEVAVNSHGVGGSVAPLVEQTDEDWRRVMDVNLTGVFNVCRAVARAMRERGSGRIVNVASVAGKEGNPGLAVYSASKAGVISLTKVLGRELAADGVIVNCVTPGAVETPMLSGGPEVREYVVSRTPMGRVGRPEEVAELIAWLCSSACTFTTGAVLDISGGRASY